MAVGSDAGFVFLTVLLAWVVLLSGRVSSEPTQDKQTLLAFLSQIPHENRIQWNASDSAAIGVGVGVMLIALMSTHFVFQAWGLWNNGFSGSIPSINSDGLDDFNVSNNRLNGSIPQTLFKFGSSSFAGNLALCGGPLPPCNPFFPSPTPSPSIVPSNPVQKKSKKLSTAAIIAISVGSALILCLLLLFLLLCLRRRQRRQPPKPPKPETTRSIVLRPPPPLPRTTSPAGQLKQTETRSVGTSYKAVLEEGTTVVVKRLKDSFYFSKDEKLLVYDFMAAGSLSALLHEDGIPLLLAAFASGKWQVASVKWQECASWRKRSAPQGDSPPTRVGKVVHGNIKSSNILLRPDHDACVSDFGLNPLFGNSTPPNRVAGYRAPEVMETRKVTFKSDVYSFGVLLLELLTGKAPNQASLGEEGIDLPRWVQSVVREEWTAEVFDVELMRYTTSRRRWCSCCKSRWPASPPYQIRDPPCRRWSE
ncbi:putative inactive receptor kinase [Vitis vinifera]|uniref:Putative inactive receptor kinase n=1 Tax=Vitis vinifera TaxID=29760 RepID=A0A438EIN0_VITVI|nr:putative inactive receptor kinase [Vitis vinifera]